MECTLFDCKFCYDILLYVMLLNSTWCQTSMMLVIEETLVLFDC